MAVDHFKAKLEDFNYLPAINLCLTQIDYTL